MIALFYKHHYRYHVHKNRIILRLVPPLISFFFLVRVQWNLTKYSGTSQSTVEPHKVQWNLTKYSGTSQLRPSIVIFSLILIVASYL